MVNILEEEEKTPYEKFISRAKLPNIPDPPIRSNILYCAYNLISDVCPTCIHFYGMMPRMTLKSLFVNECAIRTILLNHNWNLKLYEHPFEEGIFWIERVSWTKDIIKQVATQLNEQYNKTVYLKFLRLKKDFEEGIHLQVERIFFMNTSLIPYIVYRFDEEYTPTIITPYNYVSGIDPKTPIQELEKVFFSDEKAEVVYHEKKTKGGKKVWGYVYEKRMKAPDVSEKPY